MNTNEISNPKDPVASNVNHAMAEILIRDLLKERHTERRWRWIKRCAFSGAGLIMFGVAIYVQAKGNGFTFMPTDDIAAVVNLKGPIGEGAPASAEKVIPVLKAAFEAKNVKGIILDVDSPGGAPGESEQINNYIEMLRKQHPKKIIAVSGNLNASAAYLVSIHADKICAGNYSLVGSVGAIVHGWDVSKIMEKLDVHERAFASGPYKNLNSPYAPMTDTEKDKVMDTVTAMGSTFADEVRARRKGKIPANLNFATGEVWTGAQALKLGLVDCIGTVEDVAHREFGVKTYAMGPAAPKGGFKLFGSNVGEFIRGMAEGLSVSTIW
jgi:protease-4